MKMDFEKEAILDLIRALIPFLSTDSLTTLFDNRLKRIKKKLHFKEEKKYYRFVWKATNVYNHFSFKYASFHGLFIFQDTRGYVFI